MSEPEVTIIIPVFNGALFLETSLYRVADWVRQSLIILEVIVVNDGSIDETAVIAERFKLSIENYRLINLPLNCGKGAALRAGMKQARGVFTVFTDADLPYGLKIIEVMYGRLKKNNALTLIFGSRSHNLSHSKNYGWLRQGGRVFFSITARLLTIPDVSDTQCGIKMLRRNLIDLINSMASIDRFAFDIEIFAIARQNKLPYQDIPVELTHRRESSVRIVEDTILMLYDILKIRLRMWQNYYVRP